MVRPAGGQFEIGKSQSVAAGAARNRYCDWIGGQGQSSPHSFKRAWDEGREIRRRFPLAEPTAHRLNDEQRYSGC